MVEKRKQGKEQKKEERQSVDIPWKVYSGVMHIASDSMAQ